MVTRARGQLGTQHSVDRLAEGLHANERIVYRDNGNRSVAAPSFLRFVRKAAELVGVTRIANLTALSPGRAPVVQTARPSVHFPGSQNTGAQGKGSTLAQAEISALMESIEMYCAEPRAASLVRASYEFLRGHHLVANPTQFSTTKPLQTDQALMWTKAYCLQTGESVLVPAELVYVPFIAGMYETPPVFPCNTTGLASGATYLEAVVHGLYEVIERHYESLFERGLLAVEALHEEELADDRIHRIARQSKGELELQLYAFELAGLKKNLPMVAALLVGGELTFEGFGCSGNVAMSIDRAISEVCQAAATYEHGTREDIVRIKANARSFFDATPQPTMRTLRVTDFAKRAHDKTFTTVREEYSFLLRFVRSLGVDRIFVANLTRVGIDIPVVKVVCNGLELPQRLRRDKGRSPNVIAQQFPSMVGGVP